ncbi:Schwannomin-interacting protein 1 [Orchesella cincta]|uniref:Schwannomin-interacting protein 1 n=1 Tax=Orchesella cincta TaxID=48709 RepID=A0A1D2MWM2_ORCCI|nr:Schwannomin-interacting protein 1 [Orchesella cincta]
MMSRDVPTERRSGGGWRWSRTTSLRSQWDESPVYIPDYSQAQSGGIAAFGGGANSSSADSTEDFQTKHTRLQTEARQALSQAKEMARLQMAQEKDQRLSPITEMLRNSLEKVGVQLQPERRRLTRQLLTEMNVAQLQVIVNDLHSHIEMLNETLVSLLLERDDLHMEQDSMLVDIEDLTRYLAAKDNSPHQSLPVISTRSYLGKK